MASLNKQNIQNDSQDVLYLTIDQGGHASRAIVYDQRGVPLSSSVCEIDTFQQGNRVEHDAQQFIDSITTVIDEVLSELGDRVADICCAGIATQRSSIIAWDSATDEMLSPIISWQDRRAVELLSLIDGFRDETREITGLFPNAHYGATKIHWCMKNIPEVQTALTANRLRIAPVASFILNQVLVEKPYVVDPSNGSRTMLLDVHARRWSADLLAKFEIPLELLPMYVPTQWDYGHIAFKDCLIPVNICTGDQAAAFFVDKVADCNTIYINAGTGVFIQKLLDTTAEEVPPQRLLQSIVYQDEQESLSLIEGTVNGAGRALQWFADQEGIANLDKSLLKWVNEIKDPPLFFNGISGVGSPFWVANFQSQFNRTASTPEKSVAILESIVFLCMENILRMPHSNVGHIVLSGGLSQNAGFCQRLANLAEILVLRKTYSEATCRGLRNLLVSKKTKNIGFLTDHNEKKFVSKKDLALNGRFNQWRSQFCAMISESK